MTGANHQQAVKLFLVVFVFLGAVIFLFWQTAKQGTQPQVVQVVAPEKKAGPAFAFADGIVVNISFGDATVSAEVAQSVEKKKLGLGARTKLHEGTGMLFVFNNPGPCPSSCSFWNKDMLFPIDMVWIYDNVVVDVYEHLPPYAEKKDFTVSPKAKVNFVLEVPDGFIKANKIKIGDIVTYEPEKN